MRSASVPGSTSATTSPSKKTGANSSAAPCGWNGCKAPGGSCLIWNREQGIGNRELGNEGVWAQGWLSIVLAITRERIDVTICPTSAADAKALSASCSLKYPIRTANKRQVQFR